MAHGGFLPTRNSPSPLPQGTWGLNARWLLDGGGKGHSGTTKAWRGAGLQLDVGGQSFSVHFHGVVVILECSGNLCWKQNELKLHLLALVCGADFPARVTPTS